MLNEPLPQSNRVEKREGMGDEERRGEKKLLEVRGKWKGRNKEGRRGEKGGILLLNFQLAQPFYTHFSNLFAVLSVGIFGLEYQRAGTPPLADQQVGAPPLANP